MLLRAVGEFSLLTAASVTYVRRFLKMSYTRQSARHFKTFKDSRKGRLVWVDLEMTGLDVNTCHIIEIACLITDGDLNIIAEGPQLVIHQPDHVLDAMGDWCKEHHGKSGLTAAVKASDMSLERAEQIVLDFAREYTPAKYCPLAGNSVHADKKFLDKYMPNLMNHLHYRIVDVSTLKELCRRWYPAAFESAPKKMESHRALDDIKESLKELQYYRKTVFKTS